jgi:hypothetical protein
MLPATLTAVSRTKLLHCQVTMMQNLLDKALEKKTDADAAVVKVDARFAAERSKVKPNQVNGQSIGVCITAHSCERSVC